MVVAGSARRLRSYQTVSTGDVVMTPLRTDIIGLSIPLCKLQNQIRDNASMEVTAGSSAVK